VTKVAVAEACGNVVGPAFELGGVHLDGGATLSTRQVVMVGLVAAPAILRLAPIGHHDVDLTALGELLELAVHRGERDFAASAHDHVVQFLGADEAPHPFQGTNDLATLGGVTRDTHVSIVVANHLFTGMILTKISRMVPEKTNRAWARWSVAVSLTAGSLLLAGCGSSASSPGLINVVGAESQYGDVLAQIGGDYVHVTSVISNPSTDPHNYEASPSIARAIAGARLIVQNGAGYDVFMNQLESASAGSSRTVLSVATLTHQVASSNPHLWYSPATLPLVASVVARDLAAIAPAHAAYFAAREASFAAAWRAVSAAIASARQRLAGRAVATTEPVGDFLLNAMGLRNLTPYRFQADVMNGIDPAPQDLVTQRALLTGHAVSALCFNAQVSSPVTVSLRSLALDHHVALVALYETLPRGLHVQTWMLDEVNAVVAALTRGTSTTRLP